ncbi:MAG: RHS repeat domain-containing protein, partial [Thermoanaerobaculia bacterium]
HLGSTRLVTDAGRNTLEKTEYFPFGEESAAPGPETKKFTGHERDYNSASGWNLDYMDARDYSPSVGRFLSVDPSSKLRLQQPQSWNRYAYSLNNPEHYTGQGREVHAYILRGDRGGVCRDRLHIRVPGPAHGVGSS